MSIVLNSKAIQLVSNEEFTAAEDAWLAVNAEDICNDFERSNDPECPIGLRIMCKDGGKWIALDNSDNCCFIEEFNDELACLLWLAGLVDSTGCFWDDDCRTKFNNIFFGMVKHIDGFEGRATHSVLDGLLGKDMASYFFDADDEHEEV